MNNGAKMMKKMSLCKIVLCWSKRRLKWKNNLKIYKTREMIICKQFMLTNHSNKLPWTKRIPKILLKSTMTLLKLSQEIWIWKTNQNPCSSSWAMKLYTKTPNSS